MTTTEQIETHTPGPWRAAAFNDDGVWRIVDGKGKRVCHIHPCMIKSDAEIDANARLVAAAPELLTALQHLRQELRAAFRLDVRKHFSLMAADAMAGTAIHKATQPGDTKE